MKEFARHIYEHLITKRKYNKLKIKLDVKSEEYEKKEEYIINKEMLGKIK